MGGSKEARGHSPQIRYSKSEQMTRLVKSSDLLTMSGHNLYIISFLGAKMPFLICLTQGRRHGVLTGGGGYGDSETQDHIPTPKN